MRWSILSCVNHYVLLTKSYWTSLTQYKSCRIHIKQPELSCFGHFRNLQIWSKCKDVRIIWLESFATFKTSFLERRGERERQDRGEGKTPPWLEIVNAENPTVLVAGPLSEARIIVMIVWWSQPHDKVLRCYDIFATLTALRGPRQRRREEAGRWWSAGIIVLYFLFVQPSIELLVWTNNCCWRQIKRRSWEWKEFLSREILVGRVLTEAN